MKVLQILTSKTIQLARKMLKFAAESIQNKSYVTSIKFICAMKKYLICGAMALVAGLFITSCTHDDIGYDNLYEEKTQTFEKVFKDLYGNIDPNHDWGFTPIDEFIGGSAAADSSASARALTRGAYENANMWAGQGWLVPDPLTANQKDIVRKYFQRVQDPDDIVLNYSDFFVQDVYKGGTNTDGSRSTETCYSAYGDPKNPIYGSNQMDQLSAGLGDHISNYNNAHCSTNNNVSSSTIGTHSDEIMLMLSSSTSYFGYNNSLQSSYKYNDMFKRVSGNTIMQWAEENNITVPADGDVSGMYFVGFDYEADLKHGLTDIYQGNSYLVTEVPAGTEGAFQIPNKQNDGDWQKGKWYIAGARDHYYSDWIIRIIPGRKRDTSNDQEEDEEESQTHKYRATIRRIMNIGRVFVEDLYKANREDLDFNDAVFDAIIWQEGKYTIDESKPLYAGRYTYNGGNKYSVEIALLAAGGTIPLTIAESKFGDVHNAFGVGLTTIVNTVGEASNVFGSLVTGKEYVYKKFDYTDELINTNKTLNDIPIDVMWSVDNVTVSGRLNDKTIVEYEKDANGNYVMENGKPKVKETTGQKAPHIICVPIGTPWSQERVNIGTANEGPYRAFPQYVSNKNVEFWDADNYTVDPFYLYADNRSPLAYGDKEAGFTYLTDIEEILYDTRRVYFPEKSGIFLQYEGDSKILLISSPIFNVGDTIRVYGGPNTNANQYDPWIHLHFVNKWSGGWDSIKNSNSRPDFSKGYYEIVIDQEAANTSKDGNRSNSFGIWAKNIYIDEITVIRKKQ